ncbi:MAG TPA: OmpA family protein [Kofleriaceae bacterium]|nr:OmpA family protein [Kofleriaceae bacterium]
MRHLPLLLLLVASPAAAQQADRDGDGVPDAADACPDANEDKDGFQDADGCPDADNDQDGVDDVNDKCPAQAEDRDGAEDLDGCPEHGARLAADRIELLDVIAFRPGSADLLPDSLPSLGEAAKLVRGKRLTIQVGVHTDSMGADTYNLRMSQKRADAVRAALIAAGAPATRVRAIGFGETRPIDSNATAEGRAHNRRTELLRLRTK